MISQSSTKINSKPGYWAVIPASVRYDTTLRPNAKLLYAEISALAGQNGFCWADTDYFARLYEMDPRSINRLLSQLENCGYIHIEQERHGNQSKGSLRKIWPTESLALRTKMSRAAAIDDFAQDQKIRAGDQNVPSNILNNKNNNINPLKPPKGQRAHRSDYKAKAEHEPERFERFWAFYRNLIPDDKAKAGNRQKAIRAWDNLSPSPAVIAAMGKALKAQAAGSSWQEGIGIPHASTWLNQHRWEDIPEDVAADEEPVPDRKVGWD